MVRIQEHRDFAYSDEFSEATSDFDDRYEERLDDAIRLEETRQLVREGNDSEFWKPIEDWMLD